MTDRWIVATSMGFRPGTRTSLRPGPVFDHLADLAGAQGRVKLTVLNTAGGDSDEWLGRVHEAFYGTRFDVTVLKLMTMPNVEDPAQLLLDSDAVWVNGGSVAGLLSLWRLHGLDLAMRAAWEAGVVLGGVSAGSLCWHVGGTTDSFGPDLRPVTNGLGLLPYGNGVHYDSEEQRRPLLHALVADELLPLSYATDDGVGLVYKGSEVVDVIADRAGKSAYKVERRPDGSVVETVLSARLL
ncbi:MAG: peptidase dipeptidase [Frankiales bacterium]|nr:peptidase dipeptidase [Frankiales bacterium]